MKRTIIILNVADKDIKEIDEVRETVKNLFAEICPDSKDIKFNCGFSGKAFIKEDQKVIPLSEELQSGLAEIAVVYSFDMLIAEIPASANDVAKALGNYKIDKLTANFTRTDDVTDTLGEAKKLLRGTCHVLYYKNSEAKKLSLLKINNN